VASEASAPTWDSGGRGAAPMRRRAVVNFYPPHVKEAVAKLELQGENRLKYLFYCFTPVVVFHESICNDSEVKHFNFLPFGTAPIDSLLNQKCFSLPNGP
jgi:hypothetical protein